MITNPGGLRRHLTRRRNALMQTERRMESHWRELRDYIQPFRGRFAGEVADQSAPDLRSILSSEAIRARRTLSAGLQSGLTSPSRQWFKLSIHDPDLAEEQAVTEWCDEVRRRMMIIMSGSSFYHALHSLYDEIAVFGTGAMIIMPDYDHVIRCKTMTVGTYYLGKTNGSAIDTLYRDFYLTAAAVVNEFGTENCSDATIQAAEKVPDKPVLIHHAIEPDPESKSGRWRSVYWESAAGSDDILRVGWYPVFPAMCPRWSVVDDDIYGYGPGSAALSDVKMLQALTRDQLEATRKQVNPPLVADVELKNRGVKVTPGGITYVHQTSGVDAKVRSLYDVRLDLNQLNFVRAEAKNDINATMYVNLFLMLQQSEGRDMTAREVIERHEEKMLALGPVLERLEWELLTPAIERIYGIMLDAQLIPETPDCIAGREIKIEYISVLAQAQQMQGTHAEEQVLSFAGSLASVKPEVMDIINADEAVREYAAMVGSPAKILKDRDTVQQEREARAEKEEEMRQAELAQQSANTAAQQAAGAKTLSEVDPGNDAFNALTGLGDVGW